MNTNIPLPFGILVIGVVSVLALVTVHGAIIQSVASVETTPLSVSKIEQVDYVSDAPIGNLAAGAVATVASDDQSAATVVSTTYKGTDAAKLTDNNRTTRWVGGPAPQWVIVDLGQEEMLSKIILVAEAKTVSATHNIYTSATGKNGSWTLQKTFTGATEPRQLLEYAIPQALNNVRYIKVETPKSTAWVGWREIEAYGPSDTLVGFWGGALIGNAAGNYIAKTAPSANTAMFGPESAGSFKSRTDEATGAGMKSILMLQWDLFAGVRLRSDYKQRFDLLWANLKGSEKQVVGFYLIDEPFHRNTLATSKIDEAQLKLDLETAIAYIKEKAPGRPVMYLEAHPVFAEKEIASVVPANIDYIGFNCYLAQKICTESYLTSIMKKLERALSSEQKLIFSVDGFWKTKPTDAEQIAIKNRFILWETILGEQFRAGKVGAVFPFIFQSVPSDPKGVFGIVESPIVLTEVTRYLQSIIKGSPVVEQVEVQDQNLAESELVTASATYGQTKASNLTDTDHLTRWVGGPAPQWVIVDLGQEEMLSKIILVAEAKTVSATHNIYTSATGKNGSWTLQKTFTGATEPRQLLEYAIPQALNNVRYIKVETPKSTAWVGWREIEVWGK